MKILLIDGYNMLYRARGGWAKGENPIVFTFFRCFRAAVNNFKPDMVYFVLEGRPVKRIELSSGEYKAQRKYHDKDDFRRQRKLIIKMLKEDFPVHVVRHPTYECDDVLANLAYITHKDDECTVISSDTDFYQMLQNHKDIKLYNPIQKRFIEEPETDYVSWKALKGDSADNIPGFQGIGNKRATKLMKDPGLLEEFLSVDGRRTKFENNIALIRFHDMETDLPDIERSGTEGNWKTIFDTFSEMEFSSIISEKFWPKFVNTFDSLV
jgi:DNA polymerase-1